MAERNQGVEVYQKLYRLRNDVVSELEHKTVCLSNGLDQYSKEDLRYMYPEERMMIQANESVWKRQVYFSDAQGVVLYAEMEGEFDGWDTRRYSSKEQLMEALADRTVSLTAYRPSQNRLVLPVTGFFRRSFQPEKVRVEQNTKPDDKYPRWKTLYKASPVTPQFEESVEHFLSLWRISYRLKESQREPGSEGRRRR